MDIKRYLEKDKIYSIHDNDLVNYLNSLNLLANLNNGYYRCNICNDKLTINNIGALIPVNNQIKIICDKPLCLSNYFLSGDIND